MAILFRLMSIAQPNTPQPDIVSLPPTPIADKSPRSSTSSGGPLAGTNGGDDASRSPSRPMIPSRPASFSGTPSFPSHPYHDYGGRKRRTESIFSFEMGPSFSATKLLEDIYSIDQSTRYQIRLNAKMDRGFFRADQDWACYRRNYFQVSSTFDVHGSNYGLQGSEVPCLLRTTQGELLRVEFFSIGISARVADNEDKKIELVQHTPKRDKGPQLIPKPQPVRAGGNLHLSSVGTNHQIATFERMQFKTATANNGKRRAAQQYYEIVIDLYANTSQNQEIRVATCSSARLVVRGRSPGHYADSHPRYRHTSTSSHPPLPSSASVNDMGAYYYDYDPAAAAAAAAAAANNAIPITTTTTTATTTTTTTTTPSTTSISAPTGVPPSLPNLPYHQHQQNHSSTHPYFQRPDTKASTMGPLPPHGHQSIMSESQPYYSSLQHAFYSRPPEQRVSKE
ncbi:hypothetical protein BX666DRAFT_1918360 [Dichotomocladium elegans]|nr:hypothetical protein BX666DRAFT_1918360 [Dichotomocladium elegans]